MSKWTKTEIFMVAFMVVFLILTAWHHYTIQDWKSEDVCTKWVALDSTSYVNGYNCILNSCEEVKVGGVTTITKKCICPINNSVVYLACKEKYEGKIYRKDADEHNYITDPKILARLDFSGSKL